MTKKIKRRITAKKSASKSARKSSAVNAFAHWPETSSPYYGVTGDVRAVLICAAFVVAGFAKLNKTNIGKGAKGNVALFVQLVGRTPLNHHRNAKRIVGDTLSAGGLTWFQHRISDTERFDLTSELVTAMQKGGKVAGLNFTRKVTG